MIALGIALVVTLSVIAVLTFLLGFRLGGHSWVAEAQRVKAEAANAQRELHDLTRAAFVAMAEEAERRTGGR